MNLHRRFDILGNIYNIFNTNMPLTSHKEAKNIGYNFKAALVDIHLFLVISLCFHKDT